MAAKPKSNPSGAAVKELERKWGKALTDLGWAALPNIILEKQHALGLKPVDVCILMHLIKHWWRADDAPWPSKKRIAQAMGMDPRSIQRRMEAMEKKGLIRREQLRKGGGKPNRYHLAGLIAKARPYANEALKQRKKHETDEKARLRRKKPFLEVVE